MRCMLRMVFCVALIIPLAGAARGGVVDVAEWSPHGAHRGCRMNMGPTGVKAWMRGFNFEVVTIDEGSPADGVLQEGDLVTGVAGALFSDKSDSRIVLGNAIGAAEASDGKLRLKVRRGDRDESLVVPLKVIGDYGPAWPYDCSKSQRILHDACVRLREAQLPGGAIVTDGGMGTFLSGLLFLGSGDDRFLDCARRAAYATTEMDFEKMETRHWPMGYGGVLLAEYYLATGDTNVLEKLQWIVDRLAKYQMQCGSWGHNGPSGAYGAMNQVGTVCAMAITLAEECGLDVDEQALRKALHFFGRYAELGAVPYGDHPPGMRIPDDNGKNASSAVLFSLQSDGNRTSDVFAQSVALSYFMRETGHTGGFFSMVWGSLAARMADSDQFQKFMEYQKWYYNLSRTWQGDFVLLPYYEALTRFDDSSYADFGGEFTTGGLALVFAVPQRKLRILGARRSVFGAELSGPLKMAREAFFARRWDDFESILASAAATAKTPDDMRWVKQLGNVRRAMVATAELTVEEVENALNEGDAYRASRLFDSLVKYVGADDSRVEEVTPRFEDGVVKWHVGAGAGYYEAWQRARSYAFQTWLPYASTAKPLLGKVPPLRPRLWKPLAPVTAEGEESWMKSSSSGVSGTLEFTLAATDFSAIRVQLRSPRNSNSKVFINGTQVAETTRGQRSGYAKIELDPAAIGLLRVGRNVLSIEGTSLGSGGNALDVGLDAVRIEHTAAKTPPRIEEPSSPVRLADILIEALEKSEEASKGVVLDKPEVRGVPERLRVQDTLDRFREALTTVCDSMDGEGLDAAMSSPVAYWRYLGATAAARKGASSLPLVRMGLASDDWRVRSASCDVISFLPKSGEGSDAVHPAANDRDVRKRLIELLEDDNAWVRYRAAYALGAMGVNDGKAAVALARLSTDPDQWVRDAALSAIDRVADSPQLVLRAASAALQEHTTAYRGVNRALRLIRNHGADEKGIAPALIYAIEHPGEGMGSTAVAQMLEMLVDVAPRERETLRVLQKVAVGGYVYDRLQGNPRKKAIDLLGKLGADARAARPVLELIAASDSKRDSSVRGSAQDALELIVE